MLSRPVPSRLADRAALRITDGTGSVVLRDLADAAPASLAALAGRSVLVATTSQRAAACAFVFLDGLVERMTIAPPDLKGDLLAAAAADAAVEAVVADAAFADELPLDVPVIRFDPAGPRRPVDRVRDTEWVMPTSGTSGRPKMVAHSLVALCGAIPPAPDPDAVWATFYDIRRYGGLQIFLRAVIGRSNLLLAGEGEDIGALLARFGAGGATAVSGTPSHWRRVLMSSERGPFAPHYVRLSGETADQVVLDGLRTAFPAASIGHAYASTEAGVAFAVNDGLEGFPAVLVEEAAGALSLKVEDGTLRIRSPRTATRYVGASVPLLHDEAGFVDTGDLIERRGDRFYFAGRRGGIINVGGAKVNPEEVEAVLNAQPEVTMSLATARRNAILGSVVAADIVVRPGVVADAALRDAILERCGARLERHKVPVLVRFVAALPLTPAGKLSRERSGSADA